MACLQIRDSQGTQRLHTLVASTAIFGRSKSCHIVLDGRGVSRRHGQFVAREDGTWEVEDLGSTNGTRVNGREGNRHDLRGGDVIEVGEFVITFSLNSEQSPPVTAGGVTLCDQSDHPPLAIEKSAAVTGAMGARRLTALYEISRRLLDQQDLTGLIEVAAASLIETLDAAVVVLGMTVDPLRESDKVVVRPITAEQITLSQSVVRRTIDSRRAFVVADTSTDNTLMSAQSIVIGGIRSALCVPLMRNDSVTGFLYIDNRRRRQPYDEQDLEFACAVGAMVGTAVENARLHEANLIKQRMEAELASAREVQQAILPSKWPILPGWQVSGQHRTCREVGGDYYDAIISRDGRLWLIIADVCGKGVPAALQASGVHTAVHALVDDCDSPSRLLARLNEILLRREVQSSFVTCLIVTITPTTGETVLATAGHPAPVFIGAEGDLLDRPVPANLVLSACPDVEFEQVRCQLAPGDTLLMYTDGLTEAMNPHSDQYGDTRLTQLLAHPGWDSMAGLLDEVLADVNAFRAASELSDDLTLLACRRSVPMPA